MQLRLYRLYAGLEEVWVGDGLVEGAGSCSRLSGFRRLSFAGAVAVPIFSDNAGSEPVREHLNPNEMLSDVRDNVGTAVEWRNYFAVGAEGIWLHH
jgi:hypothetical protein